MDRRERTDDELEALKHAIGARLTDVWTALPGTVESFDPASMTVSVQPGTKDAIRNEDGTVSTSPFPLLTDCPVVWQGGGGVTATFPIAAGDECLVVFASRCIDAWWQSGGVQEQAESRMHSLADGFALVGVRSRPRALAGVSQTSAQLRSDDGSTFFDLNPSTQKVRIVAPGGFEVVAPTQVLTAATSLTVNAPQAGFSGAVIVQGLFSFLGGMIGSAVSGAAATITGTINFIGTLTANGKRIDDTHTHPNGVGGNTGEVN
ncbi:putative transmembrane phage protein [Burkholderia aenigmatica]|uniref:Transmembrane phage protein n=1 Tax=Burkholderia aenigmatica TaxID=2015348 RepID=A0ABY6XXZ7_9BURK|nr:Gp138 family membrane-puncturing spike protein [Burkholderia aenigmatica]VWD02352.1 putative transmembrane phage protein [Burkholderia aenigmatica]